MFPISWWQSVAAPYPSALAPDSSGGKSSKLDSGSTRWTSIAIESNHFKSFRVRAAHNHDQGPDWYAFIGFIAPDDYDISWLLILIFDY